MEIKEINSQETWDNFLLGAQEKSFLHSWYWGEFQKKTGEKIWRFGVHDNKSRLVGIALVIKVTARRGNFLFIPHGPIVEKTNIIDKEYVMRKLLNKLYRIAKRERIIFIRIAPLWIKDQENIKVFKKFNFVPAPIHIHPETTWQLNINLEEKEILRNMRKTTRNLIRRAQRENVKVYFSDYVHDIKLFYDIYKDTVKRHNFVPFSYEFLTGEFKSFLPNNVLLAFAQWNKKILSGAMIIFWDKIAFYHHGASSSQFPKIPASYLLQWEIIRRAKQKSCLFYNFWGISPTENPKHPWHGLTLFKTGFGGERKDYVRTQDLPLSLLYFKNWLVEKTRKIKRRL
ncbi:MAG: peptidoglycan bridge formation glycyltransferase FemA/FemB family protein [Candidatus Bathyarchaeota archaeon]|nr:peptidoglycan bridge formation glycyltransferase FemA/FemB family protein [Candidatus Bathyarchaeota archaeon]